MHIEQSDEVEHGFELPEVRSVPEVLDAMMDLSRRSTVTTDESEAPALFNEAVSLMLEIRVPRMPEDPAELQAMLDESREDRTTYTMEEVERHLEEHGSAFTAHLERFDEALASRSWNTAAAMLLPSRDIGAPTWGGGSYRPTIRIAEDGSGEALIRNGEARVEAKAPVAGLAVVAAVMEAHIAWKGIWLR